MGDTTVTPTSQIENSLGGDTPRDSQTSEVTYRGAVGDTTASPINQLSQITLTSPATSTPGSTPVSHKKGKLKNFELQSSEESIIGTSILEEDRKQKTKEDDDIIVIKMADNTLAHNSVEEKESYAVEDAAWETILENNESRE